MAESRSEYHREWRKNNPEKVKAAFDKYVNSPGIREKRRESAARWRKNNPEKARDYRKKHMALPHVKDRRYELYREKLGPGHKQSISNYFREKRRKEKQCEGSMKHYTTRREYLWAYKAERGCKVCGEKDPICLDFHHRERETKHENLKKNGEGYAKGSWFVLGIDTLLVELTKVDVLCSNCHRKTHRDEKQKGLPDVR